MKKMMFCENSFFLQRFFWTVFCVNLGETFCATDGDLEKTIIKLADEDFQIREENKEILFLLLTENNNIDYWRKAKKIIGSAGIQEKVSGEKILSKASKTVPFPKKGEEFYLFLLNEIDKGVSILARGRQFVDSQGYYEFLLKDFSENSGDLIRIKKTINLLTEMDQKKLEVSEAEPLILLKQMQNLDDLYALKDGIFNSILVLIEKRGNLYAKTPSALSKMVLTLLLSIPSMLRSKCQEWKNLKNLISKNAIIFFNSFYEYLDKFIIDGHHSIYIFDLVSMLDESFVLKMFDKIDKIFKINNPYVQRSVLGCVGKIKSLDRGHLDMLKTWEKVAANNEIAKNCKEIVKKNEKLLLPKE